MTSHMVAARENGVNREIRAEIRDRHRKAERRFVRSSKWLALLPTATGEARDRR